ncbi:vanin-like protein 3 isoform X1 [Rhynchophorus ferrugineus]|uniref:vanin-like protein 3 isoform X1 n=1 Tax=Rhynchophorus ferrugineus TaxID=354439 RepID=UPI003FCEBEA5
MSVLHSVLTLSYLLFLNVYCQQLSYNAVVVEYAGNTNGSLSPDERVMENTKNYIEIVESVTANKSVDLIVFPESTLMYMNSYDSTAAVIPPLNEVVLCNASNDKYPKFLEDFSCAAIKYSTIIVINFTEKTSNCSSDATCEDIYYNTNVVFGSDGSIISRYRKYNLFGEYGKSKPDVPDISVFQINNITFGIMTCFDIQFSKPAFNLTKQMGIKNIIFPLNWISELPYLTALQVEQMWAQELNVVLLAAGSSNPASGAGGSGIFLGKYGPLEYALLDTSGTKVISQSVPSNIENNNSLNNILSNDEDIDAVAASLDSFLMLIDPSIKDHTFNVLNTSLSFTSKTVCHEGDGEILCCNFNISLSNKAEVITGDKNIYTYLLVAYTGIRTYSGFYNGGVDSCGVVACLNDSVESCGRRFTNYSTIAWPITFNSINISGTFIETEDKIQFPTTLLSSIRPLPIDHYSWESEVTGPNVVRTVRLHKSQDRLLTFGIFGRDFTKDYDPNKKQEQTGNNRATNSCYTVLVLVLCYLINKLMVSNFR